MNNLLESRRSAKGNESPIKLENLSPEKYGKAAYVDLTYTPSKLADNILFRDVSTLKKMEVGNGKRRQTEALNTLFQDRLNQIKEQRDGIQTSLTSQILMYKKLLNEAEVKYQAHVRNIQSKFKEQIKIIIQEKQEEAKFAQSQQQLLEARIAELEEQIKRVNEQHENTADELEKQKKQKEKLGMELQHLTKKLEETQQKMKADAEQAKSKNQELNRKFDDAKATWEAEKLKDKGAQQRQIQNLKRLQKNELENMQARYEADADMKNQEIKQIQNIFDDQAMRLEQIIRNKDKMLSAAHAELDTEKYNNLQQTKSYQKQINQLAHDNSKLYDDNKYYRNENQVLSKEVRNLRELLMESSFELQKCRDQYVRTGRERDQLLLEIRELNDQNQILHAMKKEKEYQAKQWKETYLLAKNKKY